MIFHFLQALGLIMPRDWGSIGVERVIVMNPFAFDHEEYLNEGFRVLVFDTIGDYFMGPGFD